MKKYLIIGNGVAGTEAAAEIRKNDPDGLITMFTKEKIPFYSRIRLPDYVAGNAEQSDLVVKNDKWYDDLRINLKLETSIINIDHALKKARDSAGNLYDFDRLLLATGSSPFIPPVKGNSKENIFALRTVRDAENIINALAHGGNIVIIGGGLLGIEAGHAFVKRGLLVTIVEFFDRLLPRQMDKEGASILRKLLESKGFNFRLDARTKEICGNDTVTGVQLESGEIIKADMVLFSAGVRPDLKLAEDLGLKIDRAVVVDKHMKTTLDSVYAAGDVAQFEGANFSIWPEAMDQGRTAGCNMAGTAAVYEPVVPSNRLKVAGIALASAGDIDVDNKLESDIKKGENSYEKIVKKDGKLAGCIMLGSTERFSDLVQQIR